MKIRNSFVTNSSSSSFIIASKNNVESAQAKIVLKWDILKQVHNTIKTMQQLDDYFEDYYGDKEDWSEWEEDRYKQCYDIIYNGGVIYMGSVGNEYDEPIDQLLYNYGFNDCILPEGMEMIAHEC